MIKLRKLASFRWHALKAGFRNFMQVDNSSAVEQVPTLSLADCLDSLSPFHLLLDNRGVVVSSGTSLRLFFKGISLKGVYFDTLFVEMDGEEAIQLSSDDLGSLEGRLLRLEAKLRPGLMFAAQLISARRASVRTYEASCPSHWILDLRPILETLDELEASGLTLQDLSLLDPIRVSMVTMLMDSALKKELIDGLCGGLE